MQNQMITTRHAVCILVMFTFGTALMFGGGEAKQDTWISILIALLLFFPFMIAYARILSLYPGQNLYDIMLDVLGRFFGKLVILLYALYATHLGALVMRNFSEFIQVVAMPETPQLIPLIFLFALGVWMLKSGIETFGRWTQAALPVVLIAISLTVLISIKSMDFGNLRPVGSTEMNVLMDSAFATFSFPFAESVLLGTLFSFIKPGNNPYKIYIYGIVFSTLFFLIAIFRNILVLGLSLGLFYFSSYTVVSVISLGDFFTRIEVLIGIAYLIDLFVKLCVCMFAASTGMAKLLNIAEYKNIAFPIGLLMITLAGIIYSNTLEMFEWLKVYKYYALPFQVIFPLIILIGAEIKTRLKKRSAANAEKIKEG